MLKKTVILGNFLLIFLLIFVYNFSSKKPIENSPNEITIFTQEPLLGIHAKMIMGDDKNTHIAAQKNLSREELIQLDESSVILSSQHISESDIEKELQSYKWLYVTIPMEQNAPTKTHSPALLISQIELIRDALSDATPSMRGVYFDNAGNYIHLLNTTLNWFKTRMGKFTPATFITIGDDLGNFLQMLDIENYRIKNYSVPENFLSDEDVWDILSEKNINYVFISADTDSGIIKKIQQKYPTISVYQIPGIEADTSRWGYVRFVEKIMNDFVAAFDTYD
jgi:ABC-type Zn uptake system ZnuABC Zn-binding protein ZnuA